MKMRFLVSVLLGWVYRWPFSRCARKLWTTERGRGRVDIAWRMHSGWLTILSQPVHFSWFGECRHIFILYKTGCPNLVSNCTEPYPPIRERGERAVFYYKTGAKVERKLKIYLMFLWNRDNSVFPWQPIRFDDSDPIFNLKGFFCRPKWRKSLKTWTKQTTIIIHFAQKTWTKFFKKEEIQLIVSLLFLRICLSVKERLKWCQFENQNLKRSDLKLRRKKSRNCSRWSWWTMLFDPWGSERCSGITRCRSLKHFSSSMTRRQSKLVYLSLRHRQDGRNLESRILKTNKIFILSRYRIKWCGFSLKSAEIVEITTVERL